MDTTTISMNYQYTDKPEQYLHFIWGENKICHEKYEFIIHMVEPRCFIKFRVDLAMFASFEEFYNSIADVQWIDGRPSEKAQKELLIKAWNYLAIEERILENDLERYEEEDDF